MHDFKNKRAVTSWLICIIQNSDNLKYRVTLKKYQPIR